MSAGWLRALLGIRAAGDLEEIHALRRAWPELDIAWQGRAWRAWWFDRAAEPLSARTPTELGHVIQRAWTATGAPR
jgi:hypothetical protein